MEEQRVWSNVQEKFAHILVLRGAEVRHLKVTGMALTLKKKVKGVLEAIERGEEPEGAKVVQTLDAREIAKAEVAPGGSSLTLIGPGDAAPKLTYPAGKEDAGEILALILERGGRAFRSSQEDIGVVEALLPPVIFGGIGGLFWMGLYSAANKLAAGEVVEIEGRRRGLQRLLAWGAELLGTGGTIAVGVVLGALVVGWAASRLIKRPQRTVMLPEGV